MLAAPQQDMKPLGTCIFIAIVIALLMQSISLALNENIKPHVYNKLGSKIEHKNAKSYDPFSTSRAPVPGRTVFVSFWLHGFESAIAPFREKPPRTNHPMSRSAWVTSPYYRAGLDFHKWGKRRAAWEAHRYDRYSTLEFMSRTHPAYALIGYWSGRFVFSAFSVILLLLLVMSATIDKLVIRKLPKPNRVRRLS